MKKYWLSIGLISELTLWGKTRVPFQLVKLARMLALLMIV